MHTIANYTNKISKPTQIMKKILHDTIKVEKKFRANFDFEVSNSFQVPNVVFRRSGSSFVVAGAIRFF